MRRSRERWSCNTSSKTRKFAPVRVRVRARTSEKEIKKMECEDYATLCRLSHNAPSFSPLPTIRPWGLPACLPKCAHLFSMIASSLQLGLMCRLKQKCSSRWAERDAKNGSSIEQKGKIAGRRSSTWCKRPEKWWRDELNMYMMQKGRFLSSG